MQLMSQLVAVWLVVCNLSKYGENKQEERRQGVCMGADEFKGCESDPQSKSIHIHVHQFHRPVRDLLQSPPLPASLLQI